jgi:hypothetical protein
MNLPDEPLASAPVAGHDLHGRAFRVRKDDRMTMTRTVNTHPVLRVAIALAVLLGSGACSSNGDVGDPFCDEYGAALAGLGCPSASPASVYAMICENVLEIETCPAQYRAILSCQMTTSVCGASGDIEYGQCASETEAYNVCKGTAGETRGTC